MSIRDFLENIAQNYDTNLENELRPILRNDTQKYFDQYLKKPRFTKGSGANDRQNPTKNPFIAFLNTDNYSGRPSTTEGIYPVYLFSSDLKTLYLSINQGFTKLEKYYQDQNEIERQRRNLDRLEKSGSTLASEELYGIANMIRDKWEYPSELITEIDLKSNRIGKHYESSNIVAKKYETNNLPSNEILADDLNDFIDLDEEVQEIFADLRLTDNTINQTMSLPVKKEKTNPVFGTDFVPRNSEDMKQLLSQKEVTRTKTHEKIINTFKEEMDQKGHSVVNKNIGYIDLIININNQEIICEVKSVKKRAFMNAVRDAVGQLLYYSHIYTSDLSNPKKVILLDGDPGQYLISWANSLEIGIIWKIYDGYDCCELSKEYGLDF